MPTQLIKPGYTTERDEHASSSVTHKNLPNVELDLATIKAMMTTKAGKTQFQQLASQS